MYKVLLCRSNSSFAPVFMVVKAHPPLLWILRNLCERGSVLQLDMVLPKTKFKLKKFDNDSNLFYAEEGESSAD